ncbi:unnamed protein product [Notodromas monacha]|uniref:B9 domain-containing protein 2 n=1 Tax=Notodromas monacha TaxID=399045 RepID=A0A7R9GDI8_9CRUS|nr:unnamed protein product [Notodromas monacha]CAG0917253.1 unnamed protein product [Notodromas monacha]
MKIVFYFGGYRNADSFPIFLNLFPVCFMQIFYCHSVQMAELHLIGQLVGAIDFSSGSCLFCKWSVSAGGSWRLLGGAESGQTQTAAGTMVTGSESGQWFWSHPIDVHYATKGVQGWPKLMCQVFHLDLHGRCVLEGYGVTHFPASPGLHQVTIPCWKPCSGSLKDQLVKTFLGGSVVLRNPQMAAGPEDRYKLKTSGSGSVLVEINVISRHFNKFGVHLG